MTQPTVGTQNNHAASNQEMAATGANVATTFQQMNTDLINAIAHDSGSTSAQAGTDINPAPQSGPGNASDNTIHDNNKTGDHKIWMGAKYGEVDYTSAAGVMITTQMQTDNANALKVVGEIMAGNKAMTQQAGQQ